MIWPKRKQLRLPTYDYKQNGLYFITICLHNKECLLGEIIDDKMLTSHAGRMVEQTRHQIPVYNSGIHLHEFTIMPNHIHGIIELENASISLSAVIQKFKSMTTCKYIDGVRNHHWKTFDKKLWQRNYYEHIIRNDQSLDTIQNYIINNPKNWANDQLYWAT